MNEILLQKAISSITSTDAIEAFSKKTMLNALEAIIKHARFRIDPWSRNSYKQQLVDILKSKQMNFVSEAFDRINDLRMKELQKKRSEEDILSEVLRYLQSPVFIEFVNAISKRKFNWKSKTNKEDERYHEDGAWWDQFCELMNRRHEPWRAQLLAEAMRVQSSGVGKVGYTTLWKIASLPPHSWNDLSQFLSLAGEIWVNGEYKMTVILGAFSKVSQIDYLINDGNRRLVSDLDTALTEDGLTRTEAGPIVLKREDDNQYILNGKRYKIITDPDYEDPYLIDNDTKDLDFIKNHFRFFGLRLTYVGEEIIQLASEIAVHQEAEIIFKMCNDELEEDGIVIQPIE